MAACPPSWLIVNTRSGSHSAAREAELKRVLAEQGLDCDLTVSFPDADLPSKSVLEESGIERLIIFTGDGTANSAIAKLAGWGGEILFLPGGTMNLLSGRLHGEEVEAEEILARVGRGACRRIRLPVIRCEKGDALAGFLAGPGTAWANVREAMRDIDVAGLAEHTGEAVAETTYGARVRMGNPAQGRPGGYPLLEITPSARGMQVDAYCADDAAGYLQQGWALLRRRFREGPHERLGLFDRIEIANCEGEPLNVLLDGEPETLGPEAVLQLAETEVDLLATDHGY